MIEPQHVDTVRRQVRNERDAIRRERMALPPRAAPREPSWEQACAADRRARYGA